MNKSALRAALLGAENLPGLARYDDDDSLPRDLDLVVVLYPSAHDAQQLARLRRARPAVTLLAWLAEYDETQVAAAFADGYDDVAIGRAQVEQRLRNSRREVTLLNACAAQSEVHEGLVSFILEIASSTDLQQVLHVAVVRLSELFSMDRVSVVLLRPEQELAFVVMESQGGLLDNVAIRIADYPELQEVVRRGEPLFITDTLTDALMTGVRAKIERASAPPRAALLFPLRREDRVVGVLFLRSKRPIEALEDRLVAMGRMIASVTSVAIGNALEYDSLLTEQRALLQRQAEVDEEIADLRQFSDFFEQASDGIVVTDSRGAIRYANASATSVLRRSAAELGGRMFHDLVAAESAAVTRSAFAGEPAGDAHGYVDIMVPVPDAAPVVLSAALRRLQTPDSVLISFRDVTELREIESELRQTKEFLENLIQSSIDPIIAADMTGRIILFNRAAEQLLGYSADDTVGQLSIRALHSPGEAEDIMRRLRSDAYGGAGRLALVRTDLVTHAGEVVPVNLSAATLFEEGRAVATLGIYSDLRERLRIEDKLSQVQEQLQLSERQSVAAELAGAAAHELNQPLTSILGYAEMLRMRLPADDPNRRPAEVICEQTERMAAIVRKIGQITAYQTKPYVGDSKIIDLGDAEREKKGDVE